MNESPKLKIYKSILKQNNHIEIKDNRKSVLVFAKEEDFKVGRIKTIEFSSVKEIEKYILDNFVD